MTDESALAGKTCIPCQGGIPRLGLDEALEMAETVAGWDLNDDATRIARTYAFDEFAEAQAFANAVGDLCEEEFHHADITYGWGYCRVEFHTHKIRGLHENDFVMAAKTNGLFKG